MSQLKEIAHTDEDILLAADSDIIASQLWFKTEPLKRSFIYHAAQLQLITESRDQGYVSDASAGSWSWFELAIYENAEAEKPKIKDGNLLVWRSHCNSLALGKKEPQKHFGLVFDRRKGLLDELEIGNVIGVRACARFPGWQNYAGSGQLVARILDEPLFSPSPWSLQAEDGLGSYTVFSSAECNVDAVDPSVTSKIWFATPPLSQAVIEKAQSIQLFTNARNQGYADNAGSGSWTWFDIVILAGPEETVPKVKNGRSLEWRSHVTSIGQEKDKYVAGHLFDKAHEILSALEPNDVVAVRVCAQFSGWSHYAHDGRLALLVSKEGHVETKFEHTQVYEAAFREKQVIAEYVDKFLDAATPNGEPPAYSVEAEVFKTSHIRADALYRAEERPLRLLSLDGGGVRGISSLVILQQIEEALVKLTGNKNVKPCEYFDLIGGTSTGGLIAIMLGRLRMSIDECTQKYRAIAERIFSGGVPFVSATFAYRGYRYDASVLEQVIKEVVSEKLHDPEAVMFDPNPNACKTFVVACRAKVLQNELATHMRTYDNPRVLDSLSKVKIWQAARATSAAPIYFPRIQIGDWEYVDGGMGFNNPAMLLWLEARLIFGDLHPIGVFLSVGTGHPPNADLGHKDQWTDTMLKKLAVALENITTGTENTHNLLQQAFPNPDVYYRFNVGKAIAEKWYEEEVGKSIFSKTVQSHDPANWAELITLDAWDKMPAYEAFTKEFMKGEVARVESAAGNLAKISKGN